MKSKLLFLAFSLLLLTACGDDDDNIRNNNPDIDYTQGLDGSYQGTYTGTYTDASTQNFGESAFATITIVSETEVDIDLQQGSRFRATLGDPQSAPSFTEVAQGMGRFAGANEISGRINPTDETMNFEISGNYTQGGTYEITFEGTLID